VQRLVERSSGSPRSGHGTAGCVGAEADLWSAVELDHALVETRCRRRQGHDGLGDFGVSVGDASHALAEIFDLSPCATRGLGSREAPEEQHANFYLQL